MMNRLLLPLCLLAAAFVSACSFSESSKSSSTSSGSISNMASSPSKSSETSQQGYDREVADYTAEFVKSSNGDMASFRLKLGKFAASRGISNWEEDKTTYVAIGKGLRKAGLGKPQYEAFKSSLGEATQWKMDAIAEGYQ